MTEENNLHSQNTLYQICVIEMRTKDTSNYQGSQKKTKYFLGKRSNLRLRRSGCIVATARILRRSVATWWTCAELNCGLTRFIREHYTLILWLNLARKQSADNLPCKHVSEIHRIRGETSPHATFPTFVAPRS